MTDNVECFFFFTPPIGGDAPLSARGKRYGDCLSRFIQHQRQENKKSRRVEAEAGMAISPLRERTVAVWTSMLTRTKETVEGFDPKEYDIKHIRFLNEIYAGECFSFLFIVNQLRALYCALKCTGMVIEAIC